MSPLVWKSTPSDDTIKVDDKAHLLVLVLVVVVVVVGSCCCWKLLEEVVVVVPFPGRDWKCCAFPVPFPGCDWKCCVFPVPFPGCDWNCCVFPLPFPGWDRKCCVFPIPFLQRVRSAVFPSSLSLSQFPSSSLRGFPSWIPYVFPRKVRCRLFSLKKENIFVFSLKILQRTFLGKT